METFVVIFGSNIILYKLTLMLRKGNKCNSLVFVAVASIFVHLATWSSFASCHTNSHELYRRQETGAESRASSYVPPPATGASQKLRLEKQLASVGGVREPTFGAQVGNVTAVLGRDARLVCVVDNLGSHQVSIKHKYHTSQVF